MNACFTKKQYIINKNQIVKKIFSNGKQIATNLLKVVYLETRSHNIFKIKVAFFVSKKQIRKSFQRNKIKRLMRRSYQLNKNKIPFKKKIYYIIFIYLKQKIQNFSEIKKCFEHVIQTIFVK
ncbi:ribonuclease P protein component [Candidatus Karelsulcia muelleri]